MKKLITWFLLLTLIASLGVTALAAEGGEAPANRSMAVSALWVMAGQPVVNYALDFQDVSEASEALEAIRWAASEGIAQGLDGQRFGPDDPISREQLAVMLYRFAQKQGLGFVGDWMFLLNYEDAGEISGWASEAMHWTVMKGLTPGAEGRLSPAAAVTGGELKSMIAGFARILYDGRGNTQAQRTDAEVSGAYQGIDVPSPDWVGALDAAGDATQMLIVAAFSDEATDAWVSLHEKRSDGSWHMVMTTPGFIGKNGLGKTREGDAKTPVGVFHFNRAFGIADDPGCAIPYVKVDEDTYWSGDPREGYHYNELVSLKDLPGLDLESGDSEHIIEYVYHYQYCLNISYNEAGTPGLGSAIFLHCFGPVKPFTGGCVAIPEAQMRFVMQQVNGDTAVVIDSYEKLSGGADWPSSTWPQER